MLSVYSLEATFDSGLSSSSRVRLAKQDIHVQAVTAMAISLEFSFVFTLVLAVVFAFPQPNSDDSAVAFSPEASAPAEGESVDTRYRPVHRPYGYGGQQYGSNYYSNQQYQSHYSSQQYGHSYGHQNYGYGHQPYYGHDHYDRPYGYGYNGYPGYYYGRPQGILGTVGNVLDGLLGLREGEKKQTTDGVVAPADAQPPAAAIDSAPASEIASGGDGVVFQ